MTKQERHLLKHFLATLAYRTQKALQDAPEAFASFKLSPGVRTPKQLLNHMSEVLTFALGYAKPVTRPLAEVASLAEEEQRFFATLEQLGLCLQHQDTFAETSAEQLLQGPFSDAMTHTGQLAMLRRLSGSAIAPENFYDAEISASNLSANQPAAAKPDAQWFDAEGKPQRT